MKGVMNMREKFLLYEYQYAAISKLPVEDQLPVFKAICEFCLYGKEPELETYQLAIFELAKPKLLANLRMSQTKRGLAEKSESKPKLK